jgi:exopolysaccharide production protein ExoZ
VSSETKRKYDGLQVMRLVAACLVLCTHSMFYASERLDKGFHFWPRGAAGVDIFFVLSGFVMVYSSAKLLNLPGGWRTFVHHRIVRIVPMYWLAMTVKVGAMLATTGMVLHAQLSWPSVLCSYLFLPYRNFDGKITPLLNVGWTLNFEMFFYFLFALALYFRVNIYRFLGVVLSVLALLAAVRRPEWPAVSFYLNTIVLEFFLGMLIARRCMAGKHLSRPVALVLLAVGFVLLLSPWPETGVPTILIGGIPAAMIIWATASLEDEMHRVPRIVLYFAEASYVLYLVHPMVAPSVPALLSRIGFVHPWISVAGSITLALVAAALVHRFIETPVTRLLKPARPSAAQ